MRMQLTILATALALAACSGPMTIKEKQQASEADLVKNFIQTKFKEGQRNAGGGNECAINIIWPSNEISKDMGGSVLDKLRANGAPSDPARGSLQSLILGGREFGVNGADNACMLVYAVSKAPAARKYATIIWRKENNGQRLDRSLSSSESETVFAALQECKSWDDMLAEKQEIYQAQKKASHEGDDFGLFMAEAIRNLAGAAQATRPILPYVLVCSGMKRDAVRYRSDVAEWLSENKGRFGTAGNINIFR